MKKTLLIIAALLSFSVFASAQHKALGVRIGHGIDLSYETIISGADFMEFELGLDSYEGQAFHVDGIYNIMISEPDWTSAGKWGFYGGPGAGIALYNDPDLKASSVYAGIVGNLGLEYTFNIPLQLSLDVRPRLMFGNGGVWSEGILSFGLGVRYAF